MLPKRMAHGRNSGVFPGPVEPECLATKEFFRNQGIAYQDFNLSQDQEAVTRMLRLTRQKIVPVIQRGERYLVGFNAAELERSLKTLSRIKGIGETVIILVVFHSQGGNTRLMGEAVAAGRRGNKGGEGSIADRRGNRTPGPDRLRGPGHRVSGIFRDHGRGHQRPF